VDTRKMRRHWHPRVSQFELVRIQPGVEHADRLIETVGFAG
jgi:hypothetical protein